jgi:hypothetical protein
MPVNLRRFFQTVVQLSARLICVGSLIWFGFIVAGAASSTSSIWATDGKTTIDGAATIDAHAETEIPELLMPTAGYWSFANSNLSVQKAGITRQELKKELESLSNIEVALSPPAQDAGGLIAHKLISLAKDNGATRTDCAAGSFWSFSHEAMELRLVTSESDEPKLIAAAFAIKAENDWELTTFKPQKTISGHLLPLPSDTQSTCTRRSESGELQMELLTTSHTTNQLLELWQTHGWQIRHTAWGSPESFSYLCVQDGKTVYAWSNDNESNSGSTSRTFMLTSTADRPEL